MKARKSIYALLGALLLSAIGIGILISGMSSPSGESVANDSPDGFSQDRIAAILEALEPSQSEGARSDTSEIPRTTTSAAPGDLRVSLRKLGEAFSRLDREETERILGDLLRGFERVGARTLDLYLGGTLEATERKGAIVLLQVSLALIRKGHPDGVAAFEEDASRLMANLLHRAFEEEGGPNVPLVVLLRMPGILELGDLPSLERFRREAASPQIAEAALALIASLFENLTASDLAFLQMQISNPDDAIRSLAYRALLRIDPAEGTRLANQLHTFPIKEASEILSAIFQHAPLEEIPKILIALDASEIRRLDCSLPLFQYIARAGLKDYEKTIIGCRGHNPDSENLRRGATIAVTLGIRAYGLDPKDGVGIFGSVFSNDPSPRVRGAALLGLASHWDRNDEDGFRGLIDQARNIPGMETYANSAEKNFFGATDEETERQTEEAKSLIKKWK